MMTTEPQASARSTRDRIAAALVEIVGRDGTAGGSVRRITKAAGCNESVLYDHFENKATMRRVVFGEVADRRQTVYEAAAERSRGGSARAFIEDWTRTTLLRFDEDPDSFAFLEFTSPSVIADDPIRLRRTFERLRSVLAGFETRPDEAIDASPVAFAIAQAILVDAVREIHAGIKEGPSIDLVDTLAEILVSLLVRHAGDPPLVAEPDPPIGAGPRRGIHGPGFMREDSTRARLMAAATRIVAEQGVEAATVRAISTAARCHDTDLYSKFRNKQALLHTVHGETLEHWYAMRRTLSGTDETTAEAFIDDWAKGAMLSFDREPETFAYVLLTYPPVTEDLLDSHAYNIANGIRLFSNLVDAAGRRIDLSPQNYAAFRSALIAIPRAIRDEIVPGPAVRHAPSMQGIARRILLHRAE
ncbi:MAG: hypothetical protein CMJ52_01805 [Planctomycetaceae bacterium]|nr:hypothetical protein [Planctomycetaceae bacterium]